VGSRFAMVVVCLLCDVADAQPIDKIEVRGQQRIEADAIRQQIASRPGQPLDDAKLRADIRAIYKLGVFSDVAVYTDPTPTGVAVAFHVKERPAIRKVLVTGNAELGLDKINDVLDIRRDTPADVAIVRKNRDQILELYTQHGFMLASVDHELVPVDADEVDVKFTVNEHAKVRVSDVQIIGNHDVSTDDLRALLVTRRPNALSFMNDSGVFRQDGPDRDLAILTAHYLDRGYAQIKIEPPSLRLSRDRKRMHVTISIDEGPKFTFGTIEIKGDLVDSAASHHARIGARPGATFSRTQVQQDLQALVTHYQDLGYAHAHIEPRWRIDPKQNHVNLVFEVVRGKRVYIERVTIRGNSKTRDKVIRRELKIAEGELFNGSAIERSKRRVTATGFFETVTINTERGSSDEFVVVNVEVRERRTGTLQLGMGFSSVENFVVQGQAAHDNFLGRGQSVQFQAQLSSLRRMFTFRFVEPYFLDTKWMFAFELYNQSRTIDGFSRNATGGSLTWGYPLGDHARASLTYRLEDVSLSNRTGGIANLGARTTALSSLDTANLLRGGLTSSIRGTLAWDSRDNRLLPTGGTFASVYAEYAGRYTGSENELVRWGGFARRYHRLGNSRFVLRLNGEVGVTTSLDGKGVPLTERYLLGGIYDIRGYQPRSLGPRLMTQLPGDVGQGLEPLALGGNLQVVGNAEIEFPIAKQIGISGVVFFDIGNAFNLEDRFCNRGIAASDTCFSTKSLLGGMRKSVGAGVRWMSPIGPLRFEWGIPLDLKPGEKPSGIDFTIGTSF
jgi:outer membrane protein insertion porin family